MKVIAPRGLFGRAGHIRANVPTRVDPRYGAELVKRGLAHVAPSEEEKPRKTRRKQKSSSGGE